MISADEPDWSREVRSGWAPSRALLGTIRSYQALQTRRGILPRLLRHVCVLRHRFWSVVTGADVPLNARIGGGLLLPHANGIVIHPDAVIGPNCLLFQQVTIGATQGGVPRIGGHVDIGAGAKIIGPITIGNHVLVGANAVVTRDVPAGCVVAGIPARIVRQPAAETPQD
jgi:serine O-acetyltransferase